jgi:hypothetical protein
VQASDARCGKLAGVDVGDLPQSSVHVLQILSLHHQDRLGWVEVELREREVSERQRKTEREKEKGSTSDLTTV